MREELQLKLFEKYNSIFKERTLPMSQTCMCWGIECPDGWYSLIDNMCKELTKVEQEWDIGVVCRQIKEKYGTLRFYYDVEDGPKWEIRKDENGKDVSFFDGKDTTDRRYDCGSEWFEPSTPNKEVEARLNWIINRYEWLSGEICCECGTYEAWDNPIICTQGCVSYICKKCYDRNTAEREAQIKKDQANGMTPYQLMFGERRSRSTRRNSYTGSHL